MKRSKSPSKSARKPSQERAKHTVDAILEAAARIIERDGLGRSFGTNRIAREAGVSIGSLYEYFEGKDAIVTALCALHVARIRALVDSAFVELRDVPAPAAVARFVGALFAIHSARPGLQRALNHSFPLLHGLEPFIASDQYIEEKLVDWLVARRPAVDREEHRARAFVAIRAGRNVTIHAFAEELSEERRERVRITVEAMLLRVLDVP